MSFVPPNKAAAKLEVLLKKPASIS